MRRPARRLLALVVAAFMLPAAILGVASWITWTAIWDEADRDLTHAAEMLAEYSHRVIDGHARIAHRIAESLNGADDAAIRAAEGELQDRIARFVADLPLVRGVLLLDADGGIVLRSGAARAPPRLLAGMPNGAGIALVSAAYVEDGVGLSVAIGSARKGASGGVAIVLDVDRLARGLARSRGLPRESVALIRQDGQILARDPAFAAPLPPLTRERSVMAAFAAGLERSRQRGVRPADEAAVESAFQRLDGMPGLAAVVARPRDLLVEAWRRRMLPLFAVGLPAMVGLLALALLVRRQQAALEGALAGLEQRVAERTVSLREGEERLRLAVEAGRIGTWETEIATRITTRSPRAREIFGFGPEAEVTPIEDWGARIHPADRARVLDSVEQVAAGRLAAYAETYRFLRPDGSWRWLESTAAVVRRDAAGRPLRLAGTVQDMTERRETEERRELLTQEVNHRARNTLAIVQAILRLTRAPTPVEYARLVEGRVAALARAQSLLAAERWTGAPFLTLLTDEIAPFGSTEPGPEGRFRIDGPEFRVRAEAVQPLGMVFHELATNAVKHGALSVREGRVAVTWRIDAAAGLLMIRWAEEGGPSPGFPKHRGVGSRVIEATVTGQLGGTVERRWPAEGLVCDIALPLARTRAGLA